MVLYIFKDWSEQMLLTNVNSPYDLKYPLKNTTGVITNIINCSQ